MADMKVTVAGVEFSNPVIMASGTFGFGREYSQLYPLAKLGGISCKGTTLHVRDGNPPPRIAETPAGMLNSVGLQNPGVDAFIREELPWLKEQGTAIIANIAGNTVEDYCEMAERLSDTDIDMIEMNISCPNVKLGGIGFGTSCESVGNITREVALAAEAEGADALSLINTLTGMRIDIKTHRPILRNNTGGLSGPAVFPVAVRMVWEVYSRVKLPIVGMGGISKWEDAVEMMLAGASAVQVGTAVFTDPYAPVKIAEGLNDYLDREKIASVSALTGQLKIWG